MQPDLEKLLELQKVDAEVVRLQAEIAALPKRVAEIETKLAVNIAKVEEAKTSAKANEQARRKYEGEIKGLQEKISKYRDQMLAVKTNDEYRALGNQIKFSEENIRDLEDKILDCMIKAEDIDRGIKAAEKDLASERAEVEKEKNEARSRTAQNEQALNNILPKRAQLRAGIDAQILAHYDRVLKARGSALSEVREQICTACRVMLRIQVYADVVAGNQLLTCDSCGRILYCDPSHEGEAAVGGKPDLSSGQKL